MGFSISWIAFKGVSKEDALTRVGLRDLAFEDGDNSAPFSAAALPTGWVVLFANDFDYGSPEKIRALAPEITVVACQAEEHVMFSAAHCALQHEIIWSVSHDGGQHGVYDLISTGTLPPEFPLIRERLRAAQDVEAGSGGLAQWRVDHLFDIPVELACALTGYRHDRAIFDWGRPDFTVAEPRG
jgi:hypothetical protein